MFGFLKGLFLTKDAQAALAKRQRQQKALAAKGKGKPMTAREAQIAAMQSQAGDLVTPERAELIRKAMEVCKAKQTVLADLDSEQKQRLIAMAMKRLLNEGRND